MSGGWGGGDLAWGQAEPSSHCAHLVSLRLDEALKLRREKVRRRDERLKQRRQLSLDHLTPLILHLTKVSLKLSHPREAPVKLLVDAHPRRIDLLRSESEVRVSRGHVGAWGGDDVDIVCVRTSISI